MSDKWWNVGVLIPQDLLGDSGFAGTKPALHQDIVTG